MQTKVLVTNGGPHSPDDLGLVTAEQITDTDPDISQERNIAAQKIRIDIAGIMSGYHRVNQDEERARLQANEISCAEQEEALVDRALQEVTVATAYSPWQLHYRKPDVQRVVRHIISKDLQHARHIERQWHHQSTKE